MSELTKLKEECLQREKNVEKLNNELCKKIILHDINILKETVPSAISSDGRNVFHDDGIKINISDGMLEIDDRRGSAFLWLFEIHHDNYLRLNDIFKLDKNVYSVKYIEESAVTENILNIIRKVIVEFDNSISILESDIQLNEWRHTYHNAHEDITCNSLQEVFETVLNRKY